MQYFPEPINGGRGRSFERPCSHGRFFGRKRQNIIPIKQNRSRIGRIKSGNNAKQRSFAASGRSEEGEKFSLPNMNTHVVQGFEVSISPRYVPHRDVKTFQSLSFFLTVFCKNSSLKRDAVFCRYAIVIRFLQKGVNTNKASFYSIL